MAISPINGSWINFSFSNCIHTVTANGAIVYNSVPFSQLNASGLVCSLSSAFPWFFPLFLLVMGIVILFLFAYLQTARLLILGLAMEFVLASILWGYGFIGATVWLSVLVGLILAIAFGIFTHRG